MKVLLDDEVLFEIDERMIKLLAHDLLDPVAEIKRRLRWVIEHKCDRCFDRLSQEWTALDATGQSKLSRSGISSMPTSKTALVDLIFDHPEYLDRISREKQT